MAFADSTERTTINPVGLGAALAINAGVFAALLLIAPNVIDHAKTEIGPIKVRVIPTQTPTPPPDDTRKLPKSADAETPITRVPPPTGERTATEAATGPTTPITGGAEDILPPPDPTPPLDPIEPTISDPPLPPAPVWVAAAIHPGFASALQPPYPPGRERAEEEGYATVRVTIGTNGRVLAAAIVDASHPDFADATQKQALRKWRFKPATKDGVAVESSREMTVRFVMPHKGN